MRRIDECVETVIFYKVGMPAVRLDEDGTKPAPKCAAQEAAPANCPLSFEGEMKGDYKQ